jgi:hypothetical protein
MFLLCRFENKKASTRKGGGSNSYTVNATRLRPLVPRRFQKQQIGRSSGFRVILLAAPSQVSPVANCSFHRLLQLRVSEGISPSSLFSAPKCGTSCFKIFTTCSKKIQECQIKHHGITKKDYAFSHSWRRRSHINHTLKRIRTFPYILKWLTTQKQRAMHRRLAFFPICFTTPELFVILP